MPARLLVFGLLVFSTRFTLAQVESHLPTVTELSSAKTPLGRQVVFARQLVTLHKKHLELAKKSFDAGVASKAVVDHASDLVRATEQQLARLEAGKVAPAVAKVTPKEYQAKLQELTMALEMQKLLLENGLGTELKVLDAQRMCFRWELEFCPAGTKPEIAARLIKVAAQELEILESIAFYQRNELEVSIYELHFDLIRASSPADIAQQREALNKQAQRSITAIESLKKAGLYKLDYYTRIGEVLQALLDAEALPAA